MGNEITKKIQDGTLPPSAIELLPVGEMQGLVQQILVEVDETRKEALEVYTIFRDLLANEGEGSAATKEQIASLLQVALEAEDKKLKVLDMCLKAQKQLSANKQVNNTQNNYFGGTRRDMIAAIESAITVDAGEVNVVKEQEGVKDSDD